MSKYFYRSDIFEKVQAQESVNKQKISVPKEMLAEVQSQVPQILEENIKRNIKKHSSHNKMAY